jgi:hypothetical protein
MNTEEKCSTWATVLKKITHTRIERENKSATK